METEYREEPSLWERLRTLLTIAISLPLVSAAQMDNTGNMKRLTQYSIAGIALGSVANEMGAGAPVVIMTACIGPPLLHILFLMAKKRLS